MKIKTQYGFTVLEGLLIIVVVAVLSSAGYFVWNRNQHKSIATTVSASSTKTGSSKQGAKGTTSQSSGAITMAKPGQICMDFSNGYCITPDGKKFTLPKVTPTAEYVAWANVPSDLQQALTTVGNSDCAGGSPPYSKFDTSSAKVLLNNDDKFADAGLGCKNGYGGAHFLMVKVDGSWKKVANTQLGPWSCNTVANYHVPTSFLASPDGSYSACLVSDESGNEEVL